MKMMYYTSKDALGNIHVQNALMGMMGQHHVHTPSEFEEWAKGVPQTSIKEFIGTVPCDCGLAPGEVK